MCVCCRLVAWRFGYADFAGKTTDGEQTEGEEETDAEDADDVWVSQPVACDSLNRHVVIVIS